MLKTRRPSPDALRWDLLRACVEYYARKDNRVLVFLSRTAAESPEGVKLGAILEKDDDVVACPSGEDDDKFMLTFVRDMLREGTRARIVTNDLYRDHGLAPDWIKEHTVKFTIAADRFVPEDPDK